MITKQLATCVVRTLTEIKKKRQEGGKNEIANRMTTEQKKKEWQQKKGKNDNRIEPRIEQRKNGSRMQERGKRMTVEENKERMRS